MASIDSMCDSVLDAALIGGGALELPTIVVSMMGPLLGVLVGGWAAQRTQTRAWRRDNQRYLLDNRRQSYGSFLSAVRAYFAYAQSPDARIGALKDPLHGDRMIPILDAPGIPYRERLDAAHADVRLVAGSTITVEHAHQLVRAVRHAVAARAHHEAGQIPVDTNRAVWAAERTFINTDVISTRKGV
jgi:hypothetical protein